MTDMLMFYLIYSTVFTSDVSGAASAVDPAVVHATLGIDDQLAAATGIDPGNLNLQIDDATLGNLGIDAGQMDVGSFDLGTIEIPSIEVNVSIPDSAPAYGGGDGGGGGGDGGGGGGGD